MQRKHPTCIYQCIFYAVEAINLLQTRLAYSIGISIVAVPDVFEVYVPIFENDEVTQGTAYVIRDTVWKRISFLLDLNSLRNKGKEMIRFY